MNAQEKQKVFHGSPTEFDGSEAIPSKQMRTSEGVVMFNEISFHATPHEWIALAYTYSPKTIEGTDLKYGMGVDLYGNNQRVLIAGSGSLEESLRQMYGDGGYVYHFDNDKFYYKEGLGNHEVISNDPVAPIDYEFVSDPVGKMRGLGVTFEFIDITSK